MLLEAGSKTDVCESVTRQSSLFVAVQQQLVEAVQLLIKAGKSLPPQTPDSTYDLIRYDNHV